MDLTDGQRKFLFAGIVVVLVAVGIYLTLPTRDGTGGEQPARRPAANGATSFTVPAAAPTTAPPGMGSAITAENFDIYRLLPFSQRDFAAAADVAQRFTTAYGTYRFDEDPKTYVQRLQGLVTDQLRGDLERSASSPGLIEDRQAAKTVAKGSATIDSIRDIESSSVIFLVTGGQQVTKAGQTSTDSRQYAVTVSRDGGSWRVYAFEPADIGQEGDLG